MQEAFYKLWEFDEFFSVSKYEENSSNGSCYGDIYQKVSFHAFYELADGFQCSCRGTRIFTSSQNLNKPGMNSIFGPQDLESVIWRGHRVDISVMVGTL